MIRRNTEVKNRFPVIDFHSHILPEMDDGSESVEMTLQMLQQCRQQGIDVVLATPHFYGFRENVSDFLMRRTCAWEKLFGVVEQDFPKIFLGAEVTLFSGLTTMDGLDLLCVEGTNILLLEMPFSTWTGLELDAVSTLCLDRGYRVILAHFERFLPLQRDKQLVEHILELPLYLQVNAGGLCSFHKRKQAVDLLRSGRARLLGSDCHNLDSRPPNLGLARTWLRKKLGQRVLDEIDFCGQSLLDLDGGKSDYGR